MVYGGYVTRRWKDKDPSLGVLSSFKFPRF